MGVTDSRWIQGRVVGRRDWAESLFSITVDAEPLGFEAGQFVKLGLPSTQDGQEELVGRAYSFVNPPHERPHEFLCVQVPGGDLSPRLLSLTPGDALYVARQPSGFLVLSEVPDAESLWLMCTGTGIGPFLSILRTDVPWRRFKKVVLVQGTRFLAERTHRDVLADVAKMHPEQFLSLSLLSREIFCEGTGMLAGRIPNALTNGSLETAAGLSLSPSSAQVMLCGNPAMISETTAVLRARGMRKHRRRSPGQITVENYW